MWTIVHSEELNLIIMLRDYKDRIYYSGGYYLFNPHFGVRQNPWTGQPFESKTHAEYYINSRNQQTLQTEFLFRVYEELCKNITKTRNNDLINKLYTILDVS